MTDSTAKQQQEAREIVLRVFRLRSSTELGGQYAKLAETIAAALATRDAETRAVLEGLHVHGCWCRDDVHSPACLAARALWERVRR